MDINAFSRAHEEAQNLLHQLSQQEFKTIAAHYGAPASWGELYRQRVRSRVRTAYEEELDGYFADPEPAPQRNLFLPTFQIIGEFPSGQINVGADLPSTQSIDPDPDLFVPTTIGEIDPNPYPPTIKQE